MGYAVLPKEYAPLCDPSVLEVVESSGRVTAKTTSNEVMAITMMMRSKYNNIWYCRAEQEDLRKTVFSSMLKTIHMMGVSNSFKSSLSPMFIKCKETGAICYFSGINGKTSEDLTSTKGFTPQFGTLAMCILDEADGVKHYNHITAWESTAVRYLLAVGKMVYAYNPPMQKNHWAHKFFDTKVRNGATLIYCTWEDIRDLLNERTIADILKFRRDDPEYYKYWYLGQAVLFKGMVYPQLNRQKHIVNIYNIIAGNDRVVELILGVDEGTVYDSTCVTALAVLRSGRAVVLDLLELDPLESGQLAPTEQSRELTVFKNALLQKFQFLNRVQRHWIFECAEGGQMLMLQFQQDSYENCQKVTQKSIMGDIKRVRSMLNEGILLFHNTSNVNTEILLTDIENYVFDEKTNTVKKGQRDDSIDSLEYATKLYYNLPLEFV